jgi:hypothetical protein
MLKSTPPPKRAQSNFSSPHTDNFMEKVRFATSNVFEILFRSVYFWALILFVAASSAGLF